MKLVLQCCCFCGDEHKLKYQINRRLVVIEHPNKLSCCHKLLDYQNQAPISEMKDFRTSKNSYSTELTEVQKSKIPEVKEMYRPSNTESNDDSEDLEEVKEMYRPSNTESNDDPLFDDCLSDGEDYKSCSSLDEIDMD